MFEKFLLPLYGNLGLSLIASGWRMRAWSLTAATAGAWMIYPALPPAGTCSGSPQVREGAMVRFTYEVEWHPTDVALGTRWDAYAGHPMGTVQPFGGHHSMVTSTRSNGPTLSGHNTVFHSIRRA